jgi:hypothetical protein
MTTPSPPDVGTAPSPAPTTEDPTNFDARADAFHAFFPNWLNVKFPAVLTWIKDRTTEVYNNTVTVASNVASAAASAAAALVSANNANASAVSASADAAGALSYLNNFKGQYYGPLATDPATDPLGNARGTGDLYWNTTLGQMRVFSGGAWVQTFLPAAAYVDLLSAQTVGGVKTFSSNPVMSAGTANGVAYLNGSKVLTTGSALTFNGTALSVPSLTQSSGGTYGSFNSTGAGNAFSSYAYNGSVIGYIGQGSGILSGGSNTDFGIRAETNLVFGISFNEQMRLTSTGLGIGTSSPAYKLDVSSSVTNSVRIVGTGSKTLYSYNDGGGVGWATGSSTSYTNMFYLDPVNNTLQFYTNGTNKATIDTSGNLGLGVTPSAWNTYKAFEVGALGTSLAGTTGQTILTNNAYYQSNWKYAATGSASFALQIGGAHQWHTAPSGTAGNAITFTQAMTLDANGNLLRGQTSSGNLNTRGFYSDVAGYFGQNHLNGDASGSVYGYFGYNGSAIGTITQSGTTAVAYNTSSDYRLKNITGPITNSGAYIDSLNPVEGTWKADGSPFVGLIAHEAQEASRTTVATGEKDGEEMQGMDYSSAEIIGNMIAELKSLRARVAALESN